MRRYIGLLVVLSSVVSFLAGVALTNGVGAVTAVNAVAAQPARTAAAGALRPSTAMVPAGAVNFADVAERINAAVVNIDAASRAGRERRRRGDYLPGETPRDFELPHQGSGSGFIIDRDGYILTNFHVIEHADRITVTLADGRALNAQVVGTDPAIDVALLRITNGGPLEPATLGNSDELRV